MSEYYYYGMADVMLLTTCWTFAAVRWFHTCRAPKREHRYIWPDRKLQVLVYLCRELLSLTPLEYILIGLIALGIFLFFRACCKNGTAL